MQPLEQANHDEQANRGNSQPRTTSRECPPAPRAKKPTPTVPTVPTGTVGVVRILFERPQE